MRKVRVDHDPHEGILRTLHSAARILGEEARALARDRPMDDYLSGRADAYREVTGLIRGACVALGVDDPSKD